MGWAFRGNTLTRSSLFAGPYLFHLHTTLTDGRLGIADYFAFAAETGFKQVIFLEHIRRQPSYDVRRFVQEIATHSTAAGVTGAAGFEARLLPDGSLDIDEANLSLAAVLGLAVHSFPDDPGLLRRAFRAAVARYTARLPQTPIVWVHPGLWWQKRGLPAHQQDDYHAMLRFAQDHGVLIERNLRYNLVDAATLPTIAPDSLVIGLDSHNRRDLARAIGLFDDQGTAAHDGAVPTCQSDR